MTTRVVSRSEGHIICHTCAKPSNRPSSKKASAARGLSSFSGQSINRRTLFLGTVANVDQRYADTPSYVSRTVGVASAIGVCTLSQPSRKTRIDSCMLSGGVSGGAAQGFVRYRKHAMVRAAFSIMHTSLVVLRQWLSRE